jgi:hypothetical protein
MHRISDAVVTGGRLLLANLPFAEGQHVEVLVAELPVKASKRQSLKAYFNFRTPVGSSRSG